MNSPTFIKSTRTADKLQHLLKGVSHHLKSVQEVIKAGAASMDILILDHTSNSFTLVTCNSPE